MRNGSQCLKGFMEFTERTHTQANTKIKDFKGRFNRRGDEFSA